MPAITDRDKRTLQIAALAVSCYLVLFFGFKGWKYMETSRSDYQKLLISSQTLEQELRPYENRALLIEKLKENFRMDPGKLSKSTVVAQASAAIQTAANSDGILLGPIRESPGRSSAKEMASMQLEAVGPIQAIISLIPKLERLGFPLILDGVQISLDPTKPGMIKLNLTVVILDFETWKSEEEARNA